MHNQHNSTFPMGVTNNNPIVRSLYATNNEDFLGVSEYVETDDLLKVTTDDGEFVTTDN